MLGFLIRRCAVALGHEPSEEEFARWANHYEHDGQTVRLFGRPITKKEAQVMMRHRSRLVAIRQGLDVEDLQGDSEDTPPADAARGANTISFAEAAARLRARGRS